MCVCLCKDLYICVLGGLCVFLFEIVGLCFLLYIFHASHILYIPWSSCGDYFLIPLHSCWMSRGCHALSWGLPVCMYCSLGLVCLYLQCITMHIFIGRTTHALCILPYWSYTCPKFQETLLRPDISVTCAWHIIRPLPVTPAQLMTPGIGRNASCALGDFHFYI